MKKIGFYWDNTKTKDVDCSEIKNGNPGLGGSVYLFIMLAYYLQLKYREDFEVVFFCQFPEKLPQNLKRIKVKNFREMILKSKIEKLDILILDSTKTSLKDHKEIKINKIDTIIWGHCFANPILLKKIQNNKNVKKYICVGKEQMEQLIDMKLYQKSEYIYNLFDNSLYNQNINFNKKENIVTYIGAINKGKGFHIIAKEWKKILKSIPDAKLYVIGSGKLYNRYAKLGKYEIAEESYEKSFINYLLDEDGEILESVKFFGHLGMEKNELISKSKIGICSSIINETFGLTALEFQASGVPVIAKRCHGYLDTVKDGYTGYLYEKDYELGDKIIQLLKDEEKYNFFRENVIKFVGEKFNLNKTLEKWKRCIDNLECLEKLEKEDFENLDFDRKNLRLKNQKLKKYLPLFPSVLELEWSLTIPTKLKNRLINK